MSGDPSQESPSEWGLGPVFPYNASNPSEIAIRAKNLEAILALKMLSASLPIFSVLCTS